MAQSIVQKTALGNSIIEVAMRLLNLPLREDAGENADRNGVIRSLFLEGIPWPARYWDDWKNDHPESTHARPPWAAAFACYCVRQGYAAAGIAHRLPSLSADVSGLGAQFRRIGRFIERDEVFDVEGRIKPNARLPGPGDIVLFQDTSGILVDLFADGKYETLQGNTRPNTGSVQGVYKFPNSPTRKVLLNSNQVWDLTGFCRLASADGAAGTGSEDLGVSVLSKCLVASGPTTQAVDATYSNLTVTYGSTGFIEWKVRLPTGGPWYLHARMTAEDRRPCSLSINGVRQNQPILAEVTGSWHSDRLKDFTYGPYEFRAGENVFRIDFAAYMPHLQMFWFTKGP